MTALAAAITAELAHDVGERVRIEHDETRYPSMGTWPQFRDRTGTVVEINEDRKRPHLTEFGVVFGKVNPRTDGRGTFHWSGDEPITWFKAHELSSGEAPEQHAAPGTPAVVGDETAEVAA